jgi:hypothetical protein
MKEYGELKDTPFFRELRPLKPEEMIDPVFQWPTISREQNPRLVRQQVDMIVTEVKHLENAHAFLLLSIKEMMTLLEEEMPHCRKAQEMVLRAKKRIAEIDI